MANIIIACLLFATGVLFVVSATKTLVMSSHERWTDVFIFSLLCFVVLCLIAMGMNPPGIAN